MTDTKDPLVTAVEGLTTETTELLVEYRNIKAGLEGTASTASKAAKDAKASAAIATSKAEDANTAAGNAAVGVASQIKKDIKAELVQSTANVTVSKQQVTLAKAEVTKASQQVSLATTQAVLAKTSADKAKEVTGMDTAQQLVDVAVTDAMVAVNDKIDAIKPALPQVWCPLDNKLTMLAGIGEPTQLDIAGTKYDIPETHNVKFSRGTVAWLDGKEYAVGEPRYTADGKLVVESQSTNGCKWSLDATNENSFFVYGNDDPLTYANVGQSPFDPIGINAVRVVNTSTSGLTPRLNYTTLNAGYTAGDQLTVSVFIKDFDFTTTEFTAWFSEGLVSFDFTTDTVTPKYETNSGKIERLANGWVRVSLTFIFNAGFDSSRLYAGLTLPANSTVTMCGWQVEKSDTATSYIPIGSISSSPIVTRAADIALISGANQVKTWENDQQPIEMLCTTLRAGEHDIVADPTKFSRGTKAWLDGKEYAVNVPRYTTDGKLLIEPQSTNLLLKDLYKDVRSETITSGNFLSVTTSKVIGTAGYGHRGLVIFDDIVKDGSGTLSAILDLSKTDTGAFMVIHSADTEDKAAKIMFNSDGTVKGHFNCTYTLTDLGNKLLRVVLASTNADLVGGRYCGFGNWNVGGKITFKNPQYEQGTVATSYIPTTTTAVTRAADECFVDYQLPPNKYRDLKGFIK